MLHEKKQRELLDEQDGGDSEAGGVRAEITQDKGEDGEDTRDLVVDMDSSPSSRACFTKYLFLG